MMHKKVFLGLLLVPFILLGYDESTKKRINELEEMEFQKIAELSELAKKITQADEFNLYLSDKIKEIITLFKAKRISYLEAEKKRSLSYAEINKIGDDIYKELEKFMYSLKCNNSERNVEDFLFNELYDREDMDGRLAFNSIKFIGLREYVEYIFLKGLVKKSIKCFIELQKISNELKELSEQK